MSASAAAPISNPDRNLRARPDCHNCFATEESLVRILHCIDSLGGGGAERQLTGLVEGLVDLGHEVDVAFMLDGPHGASLRRSGATLHPIGWRAPLPLVAELCRIIRERKTQVVQTWLQRMSVSGGVASRLTRRPWVYSERSSAAHDVGWRAAVRRRLAARAAAIAANSEAGAAPWRRTARDPRAVHVVPNGVDLDGIRAAPAAARAALGLSADAEVVLFAGRFVPPKNIPLLVGALARLVRERKRAVALACGDGPELVAFRAAANERCRALGYRADLWSLLKMADVLIAPSLYEGRPNVVLEAAAAGCPLVLSDIAPHRECLPAAAALWFAPHSAVEAARALGRALDDRPAARARAERARRAVDGSSLSSMARAYERLYRDLVAP
jgi:glycosyltransferase involved in cell wall biosynthesis